MALLVLLCIPIPGIAQDVEVAHRVDSLDVTVQSRFRAEVRAPAEFTYEYDVTSAPDVASVAATLATMADPMDTACAVGWATDCGACNRMANELSLALREVTDGKTSAAAGRMDRFRTRLDREKDRGLNPETHRLLAFYLRRLSTLGLD